MDTYANMLLIAIPVFFVSALLEALYGNWIKDQKHNFMDTVSSLTSGITNSVSYTHLTLPTICSV